VSRRIELRCVPEFLTTVRYASAQGRTSSGRQVGAGGKVLWVAPRVLSTDFLHVTVPMSGVWK
jgi:hypothetical protein